MDNEIDINGVKVSKAIIYNAALEVINNIDDQLKYIDSTGAYDKYKILDILTQIGRHNYWKERMQWAKSDRWEDATGEFGLEPTNPIMVADFIGEASYLSHLRWNGKPVVFFQGKIVMPAIDVMHVFSLDGDHLEDMYFDIFHRFQTSSVPRGYTWAATADGLTGTSRVIQDSFADAIKGIYEDAQSLFGVPVVSPQLTRFNVEAAEKLWLEYTKSHSKG